MINKMHLISVAFINSVNSVYSAGIEDRIYFRFAETHVAKYKWQAKNTRSDLVQTSPQLPIIQTAVLHKAF